jgi:hypothetical protein
MAAYLDANDKKSALSCCIVGIVYYPQVITVVRYQLPLLQYISWRFVKNKNHANGAYYILFTIYFSKLLIIRRIVRSTLHLSCMQTSTMQHHTQGGVAWCIVHEEHLY